jgi:hypothetical protein
MAIKKELSDDDNDEYLCIDCITGRKMNKRHNPLKMGKPTRYDMDDYFLDENYV